MVLVSLTYPAIDGLLSKHLIVKSDDLPVVKRKVTEDLVKFTPESLTDQ